MLLLWPALAWASSVGAGTGKETMARGAAALAVLVVAYLLSGVSLLLGAGLAIRRRFTQQQWPPGSLLLMFLATVSLVAPFVIAWMMQPVV